CSQSRQCGRSHRPHMSTRPTCKGAKSRESGGATASECLSNTEEEVEMTGPLRIELSGARYTSHRVRHSVKTGERRWIQIVTEIEPDRADRSLVMHPYPDRMGNVVEVALGVGVLVEAQFRALLAPAKQIVHHVTRLGENVAHVMKERKA